MKKVIALVLGAAALSACSSTYYDGHVNYSQDGQDCEYTYDSYGDFSAREFDVDKDVTYKNALCRDVMARDVRAGENVAVSAVRESRPTISRNIRTVRGNPYVIPYNYTTDANQIEITIE